ncbi:MAG: alkaline phosphatase family protein [Elusimicrobia bacterium]|nr:alkaline phosphatase family protein [Candidatus Obscuribacterium magneticum]
MKTLKAVLFLLCFQTVGFAFETPKLVVVVVVDQMRAEYLDLLEKRPEGRLKKHLRQGAVFTQTHVNFIPTETAPGHAAILTGKTPCLNGIVGNRWWDKKERKTVSALTDATYGIGPLQLMAPTVGDLLRQTDPLCQVVSISIKDRGAILLGGHKANTALWFNALEAGFVTSAAYGRPPGWLKTFNKEHVHLGRWRGRILIDRANQMLASSEADQLLIQLANKVLEEYQLGKDDHPDILTVSFSAMDYIGHKHGPHSPQTNKYLTELDSNLDAFLTLLQNWMNKKEVVIVLTADHGVSGTWNEKAGVQKKIMSQASFKKQVGKSLDETTGSLGINAQFEIVLPAIYLTKQPASLNSERREAFLHQTALNLKKIPGIADIFITESMDKSAPYYNVYARSVYPGRSGDLVIRLEENVFLAQYKNDGTHGSPYEEDTHVPLVFWGPPIRAGRIIEEASIIDIAPTLAALLSIELSPMEGSRVLWKAFKSNAEGNKSLSK